MIDVWLMRLMGLFGKGMHVADRLVIRIEDAYGDADRILDLGGGGAGVIGVLRGKQVVAVDNRQDELDESPEGPVKVLADARELPFEEASFDAATAFFFLMYVQPSDRGKILAEAFRVLKPGAALRIWDATIPPAPPKAPGLFVVPVTALLPGRTLRTAYGAAWKSRTLDPDAVVGEAGAAGFELVGREEWKSGFHLVLRKRESSAA